MVTHIHTMLWTALFTISWLSLSEASHSVFLSPDVREAMDQYMNQRIRELKIEHTKELMTLRNRIEEVETMRVKDVQGLRNRIAEVETLRATEAQILADRIAETDSMRLRGVQDLKNSILEMNAQLLTLTNHKSDPEDVGDKDSSQKTDVDQDGNEGQIEGGKMTVENVDGESASGQQNRIKRVDSTSGVVFHALLATRLDNPANGHTIRFTNVITNVGGNYHPSTGVFTCVRPGVYLFSWSTRVPVGPSQAIDTGLVRNGAILGSTTAGAAQTGDAWGQGSATVALHLDQGDEIWVKVTATLPGTDLSGSYTMFTGVLVHG